MRPGETNRHKSLAGGIGPSTGTRAKPPVGRATACDLELPNDAAGPILEPASRGTYDSVNRECHWTKTYPGSHDVSYRGFQEGKGIWGTWEIGIFAHGGFHIWPKGEHDGEIRTEAAETAAPVEASRGSAPRGFDRARSTGGSRSSQGATARHRPPEYRRCP